MPNPNPLTKVPDEDHSMVSDEPDPGRCNEELDEGFCMRYPALTEEGELVYDDGKCFFCEGGDEPYQSSSHQLYTKRSDFFKTLDPYGQAKVDELIESMMSQAPFDRDNSVKAEIVRQIAIDIAKVWKANDYMADKGGMAQSKVVDLDEEGHPIYEEVENIMNIPIDRLERSIVSRMEKLGIIDENDKSEEVAQTLADILSG